MTPLSPLALGGGRGRGGGGRGGCAGLEERQGVELDREVVAAEPVEDSTKARRRERGRGVGSQ